MKSMTGYAFREAEDADFLVSVEIKGYNSRFLDLSVFMPPYLSALESRVRQFIAARCNRGKVDVTIRFREYNAAISVYVNPGAVQAYQKAIALLAQSFQLDEKPDLKLLLSLEGVLEIEKQRDDIRYWQYIEPLLIAAADQFEQERLREGKHTQEDIFSHIAILEAQTEKVTRYGPVLEASIQENLKTRFTELLGDSINENRILTETAVMLVRYTISEELSRLDAHLKEFRIEAEKNPSPGKKLDFLCQEINREVNTIGSKTPVLEVSRSVVEMKNALENIREQLRNVE